MQAARAARLCTPKVFMVSVKSPNAPLPEMGLISAKGRISSGKLMVLKSGERNRERASIAPDVRSIAEAERMAIRDGRMESTVFKPFFTPRINVL